MAETSGTSSVWSTFLGNLQQSTSATSDNQQIIQTQQIGQNATTQQAIGQTVKAASSIAGKFGGSAGAFGMGMQAGYQVVSDISGPILAYQAARIQKKIAGMNVKLANMQTQQYQTAAEDVLRAGNNQVAAITFQAGQVKATSRVAQATAGVRISGAGSAAETLTSQDIARDMQVNQVLANAVTKSFGYRRQAVQSQINALALKATQKSISPWAAAIGTLASEINKGMSANGPYAGMANMLGGAGGGGAAGGDGGGAVGDVGFQFAD